MDNFLLIITDTAKNYLKPLISSHQALSLDVKVSGCTGYAYEIKIVDVARVDKISYDLKNFQGINFLISRKYKKYLNNSIVDYKKEGLNKRLAIDNPSVKNECGCGESFSLKEVA